MRHALAAAMIALIFSTIALAHPVASEASPDQFVEEWLSSITPFFGDLIADMSPPQVSVVGEENFTLLGKGVTYNVTWVGEYEKLTALATFAGGYPVKVITILEVWEDAPWMPAPTMIDVYKNVTTYYQNLLKPFVPKEESGSGKYYDWYWAATYPRMYGHPVYVALGEPAQVTVHLKRDELGLIRLLIADQLGALRAGDPLERVGSFVLGKESVSEEHCGDVCRVEEIWLLGKEGFIPAYLVRSFGGDAGEVVLVDAVNGSVLFVDEWSNGELVTAVPKPLTWREIAMDVAIIVAFAPGIAAMAWYTSWSKKHKGKELPVKMEAILIIALLSGPIASISIMAAAYSGGIEGDLCIHPPGGLYVASAEQVGLTKVSATLGFSSGSEDFVVTKLVAHRGTWVSECIKCVFLIPRASTGEVRVEFDGMPSIMGGSLEISIYGHPGYESTPYLYIRGEVGACSPG